MFPRIFSGAVVVLLLATAAVFGQNGVQVDTGSYLKMDPATPHCLAFRMHLRVGYDANTNATCTMQYKKTGTTTWVNSIPLLRIHRDTVDFQGIQYKTGNMFAGSVFNLQPGTSYDVKFHMTDPEGGGKDTTVTALTAVYPPYYAGTQTLHVYPKGYSGTKLSPNYDSLQLAIKDATSGTLVLVHPGTYNLATVSIDTTKNGTLYAPTVIRGAKSEGVVTLNCTGILFSFRDKTKYIHIEGFVMQNCNTAVSCGGTTGVVIRNNEMLNVTNGINARSFNPCTGDFFMNNYVLGPNTPWYPRSSGANNYGIIAYGKGMVVCYNTVRRGFYDAYETTGNITPPQPHNPYVPNCCAVDVYNNYFSESMDDNLETDYAISNIRCWNNLLLNAHTPISTQPLCGGPVYIFRNCVFNVTQTCLKLHCQPSGLEIYNNTLFGPNFTSITGTGDATMGPQNMHLRNNVFMDYINSGCDTCSGTQYVSDFGAHDRRSTVDYNGYLNRPEPIYGFVMKWQSPAGIFRAGTPGQLYTDCGQEQHGMLVDTSAFVKCFIHRQGLTYDSGAVDFRIASASSPVIDKGIAIPGITDGFRGTAPDLGAIEYGDSVPTYGYLHKDIPISVLPGAKGYSLPPYSVVHAERGVLSSAFLLKLPSLGKGAYKLQIFDIQGKLVKSVSNITAQNISGTWTRLTRHEEGFANGMYLVKLASGARNIDMPVLFVK